MRQLGTEIHNIEKEQQPEREDVLQRKHDKVGALIVFDLPKNAHAVHVSSRARWISRVS